MIPSCWPHSTLQYRGQRGSLNIPITSPPSSDRNLAVTHLPTELQGKTKCLQLLTTYQLTNGGLPFSSPSAFWGLDISLSLLSVSVCVFFNSILLLPEAGGSNTTDVCLCHTHQKTKTFVLHGIVFPVENALTFRQFSLRALECTVHVPKHSSYGYLTYSLASC